MERRTIRRVRKAIMMLFNLLFVLITITSLIKFFNAEEVFDKIEYGVFTIICLILLLRE